MCKAVVAAVGQLVTTLAAAKLLIPASLDDTVFCCAAPVAMIRRLIATFRGILLCYELETLLRASQPVVQPLFLFFQTRFISTLAVETNTVCTVQSSQPCVGAGCQLLCGHVHQEYTRSGVVLIWDSDQ